MSTQLLAAVIAALLLAGTVLFVSNSALSEWFYRYSTNDAFAHREEQRYADKLQAYVDQHKLSGTDTDALDQWLRDHRSVLVILRRDGQPIYNAGLLWTEEASADDAPVAQYEVQFADGPAQATFLCFFENYYFAITILSLLLSFVVFVAVLLTLIRKKTRYITRMRDELRILEGGDLEYTVAVRGEDELADLARGINDMRQAVISRQQDEQEAREANHALVTAMSHDLRTPLTALIGYLDIMTMQKCKNEEEHARFLALSRSKAQQIKEMSDRLF
ncbi:histidine kinase dimerization/phospho-acceptor domain-containing protein [Butyricicoccus sp. Marseille-Q5471]|uniref:histidine kinase dimerization/phospho-acceptor domain-containing protein n=1 Tax=Butyricicoccus sp. Marseille-Q5471 TaxID=3039493 RepID=UPI0024BD1090|nr:histidine kinase dimerization/phospho-acceptor domain-containing protein [Butyricicoccus sp. Marseille-Q5471]